MIPGNNSNQYLIASVTIRNNIKALIPLLEFIRSLTGGVGLTKVKQDQAVLVLEEILTYRIENAYQTAGMITLDAKMGYDRICFIVSDEGNPYLLTGDSDTIEEKLVLKFAEKYYMNIEAGKGQSITFEFTYDKDDFDIERYRRSAYPEEKLLDANITVRKTAEENDEIIKVIECIYAAYGYSYGRAKLYNLDNFRSLLKSGDFYSYIAVNESRQVLAHASLSDSTVMRGMPDLGALVTKPFCRGLHIAERMVSHILEDAEKMNYAGVRGEPVAFHPYTQKLFTSNGLVPTGFLFHEINPESAGIYRDGDRRLDIGIAQKIFGGQRIHEVILPEEHEEFLKDRFAALGLRISPLSPDAPPVKGFVRKSMDAVMRLGTLVVSGSEWLTTENARKLMTEFNKAENIDLYLDLNNPGSLKSYSVLREAGFVMTGLVGGAYDADYLVMQHFMKKPLDRSKLVLEPNYREIFDYLTAHMEEEMYI